MTIPIIYEDNHLLVVNKPINILSQADITGDPDLLTLLKADLKLRYNKPGAAFLGLVHRLDRPVGGVMVFAKTSKAASRLAEQIRRREFKKTYLAVVHGTPAPAARLKHYLRKDSVANQVTALEGPHKGAKEAVLDYVCLDRNENLSLLQINLITGRSHQVRVQLAASGFPLYGDQKYGAAVNKPGQPIALFCREITCLHPTRREPITFREGPGDFYPWNLFSQTKLVEGGD